LINWLLAVIDEFQQDDDDGVFYTGAHHQTVAILDHYCQKVGTLLPLFARRPDSKSHPPNDVFSTLTLARVRGCRSAKLCRRATCR
jgi:hypothetical protein